jgi:hypothetical protein
VFANDTINTVLNRITNSAAGVTATLSGDKVTLTSKDASDQDITVANDTSDFVKAVRLDATTTARGDLRDDQRKLRDTGVFNQVSNGSFTINGVSIAVNSGVDTLSGMVAKINASGAGVTATLNSTTGRIELATTANSEDQIVVGNDTSGFLSMAQLSTGNTVRGNIRDDRQVLAKMSQFAAVTTGSFSVNGVAISVDKDTDSLESILNRVNSAGAGVTAAYDAATDRLVFTPTNGSLTLSNDTSGFLAAAKVATGTTLTSGRANADAAFNTTGVNGPMLDPGSTVQAGTFTVNGSTITVAADDTINSVLAKITASAAGVTATYDDATELVTLTAKDENTGAITAGNDTSGFLAAVKLGATAAAGTTMIDRSRLSTTLDKLPEYAGVTAGTFTVNGQDIAIDPAVTTIESLAAAIDGLSGVRASLNQATGALSVVSEAGALTLADTSGLLDALGMAAGSYGGSSGSGTLTSIRTGTITTTNADAVARNAADALQSLNDILAEVAASQADDPRFARELKATLEEALQRLRDDGFRGFSVAEDEGALRVEVADQTLADALELLRDDLDVARALTWLADELEQGVADAAQWDAAPTAPTPSIALEETSRAKLTADQTMTSLLMMKSTLQPQQSAGSSFEAALQAYVDGAK